MVKVLEDGGVLDLLRETDTSVCLDEMAPNSAEEAVDGAARRDASFSRHGP